MQNTNTANRSKTAPELPPPAHGAPGAVPPRIPLSDFALRVAVAVLIGILLLSLTYLLWRGVHVLLLVFAGVLFAVFLAALSDWVSRHTGLSRVWSLTTVVILLFLLTGGIGWLLANRLAVQIHELAEQLPESLKQLRSFLSQYAWGRLILEQLPNQAASLFDVSQFSKVPGLISGITSFLMTIVVIFFVGIFGAAEPELYKDGLLRLLPPSQRPRGRAAIETVAFNLRWWLVGQVVLMLMIWLTTTAGLWLIGVPLALALGVIAGILELVPYVGAWLSAVPALLIALMLGPYYLLLTAGLYLGLHILEGYVFLPLVQRRAVHMPPALTLVAQVLLGELLGLIGLFVTAPLTVAVVVLLKMLYVEDTLGDQTVEVPGEPGNEQVPVTQGVTESV